MSDVRTLVPDDYDGFHALRLNALVLSPHSYGNHIDVWRAARREQVLAMLEQSAGPSDSTILGAFVDGELVGMLGFRREGKLNVVHKATLWGFFVHPDHRKQGAGRALIQAAHDHAKALDGLNHIRLIVTKADDSARRLFEAGGYVEYGMEPSGLRSGGRFFDQIYMMKTL